MILLILFARKSKYTAGIGSRMGRGVTFYRRNELERTKESYRELKKGDKNTFVARTHTHTQIARELKQMKLRIRDSITSFHRNHDILWKDSLLSEAVFWSQLILFHFSFSLPLKQTVKTERKKKTKKTKKCLCVDVKSSISTIT